MGGYFSSNKSLTDVNNFDSNDEFINNLVKKHNIVIFSRTNCGYCTMAKKELDKLSLSYHTIELDVSNNCPKEDCHSLAKTLMLQTRMRTVPQIFIKGRLIGGFTDLDKLIKEDKLKI